MNDAGETAPVVVGMRIAHDLLPPGDAKTMAELGRFQQRAQGTNQTVPVAGRHEETRRAVDDQFWNGVHARADAGKSGRGRLLEYEAERVLMRGHDEHVRS